MKFHPPFIAAAFAVLVSSGGLAQSSVEPSGAPPSAPVMLEKLLVSGEHSGPGMWKVSKGDHVLWIIGTQIPVPKKLVWRAKGLEAIIAQSQQILGEPGASISPKQIGWFNLLTMLPSLLDVKKNPDDAMLKDIVPPALYARWLVLRDKYVDEHNTDDEAKDIERWRPMFAALELYNQAIRKSGLTNTNPVWSVVREVAKKHNVKITSVKIEPAVSNPRGALKEFKAARLADLDCFAKTIERIETDLAAMRIRANAWALGDVAALRNLQAADQRAACEAAIREASFMKTLGTQDLFMQFERAWLSAAEAALAKDAVALAILPVAQLMSTNGYLAKLRARGYAIEVPE